MLRLINQCTALCTGMLLFACVSQAESLFVGFNTQTPIQVYTTSGNYVQDIGPAGSIAVVPTSSGYSFITPDSNFTSSTVGFYNPGLMQTSSFTVDDLIDNGAQGTGNQLWLAAYGGTIYDVSATGAVSAQWATGFTHIGVAFDGSDVFTTEGDSGNNIQKWSPSGTLLGQISTPYTGLYGLSFDSSTGDFWASSTDNVYELDPQGSLLTTLDLPGDSRTPDGAVHDSIAVGNVLSVPTTAVPEPGSFLLMAIGVSLLFLVRSKRHVFLRALNGGLLAAVAAGGALAGVNVSMTPSTYNAAVGTTVKWTATASDTSHPTATLLYQFSVGPDSSQLQIVKDYSSADTFLWTPADHEGNYTVRVSTKSSSGSVGETETPYVVKSRISGNTPVVSPTAHPLVALYSVPPCSAGRTARVRFKTSAASVWQATEFKTCNGTTSVNFYVAGMRASTTYMMQQDVYNGPFDTIGPILTFTTGVVPNGLNLTPYQVNVAATAPNNTAYPVLVNVPLFQKDPFATDTQGNLIWYLPGFESNYGYLTRPVAGGTFLGMFDDNSGILANHRLLREWDLAGNVVRETNIGALNTQLVAFGTDPVTSIHHEVFRLPNGDTGLLASVEKVANQGAGPVDVLGDMAIVLDSNLQVKWWWNEFEHLNVMRPAVLGETCAQNSTGCPHLYAAASIANDWTHSNSLQLAPDGDLVISVRHQDWVIKLNYKNGTVAPWRTGQPDNTIVWTLGKGGNFTLNSSDPYAWFSHQHDVNFESNGNLDLFDNGNTRVAERGGNSRGQAWQLDEQHLVATPVVNLDLGLYSLATGTAERLSNGNYHYYLGFIGGSYASSVEVTLSGTREFMETTPQSYGYRSFRMRSLDSEY